MRPIRVTLQNRSYEEFAEDLLKCFAGAVLSNEERLRGFYERMLSQYRSIILDLDTSTLLMGLTYNSGWILCEEFVRHMPTPNTIEAYMEKQAEQEAAYEMDFEREVMNQKPGVKTFCPDEEVFSRIIEKMAIVGDIKLLSRGEREYLNLVAKYYREGGHK